MMRYMVKSGSPFFIDHNHTILVNWMMFILFAVPRLNWLKEKSIAPIAKPLGRSKALSNHVSQGERNPIEGIFG